MPELPEVETTRRGIHDHVRGQVVSAVQVRQPQLRWPISPGLRRDLPGQRVDAVERRAKFLLLRAAEGSVIIHLGMSGSLRVLSRGTAVEPHDHVDLELESGQVLRYRDPRRFGAILWTRRDPFSHKLLNNLGPEPLSGDFDGDHLYEQSRGRRVAVRDFLLNGRVVAGVGNIYANEAAYRAGIDPRRSAGRISRRRYGELAQAVVEILDAAVAAGGTTLKDFTKADGKPGYFRHELEVYGREGESCLRCDGPVRRSTLGQRSVFFCPRCQT